MFISYHRATTNRCTDKQLQIPRPYNIFMKSTYKFRIYYNISKIFVHTSADYLSRIMRI